MYDCAVGDTLVHNVIFMRLSYAVIPKIGAHKLLSILLATYYSQNYSSIIYKGLFTVC